MRMNAVTRPQAVTILLIIVVSTVAGLYVTSHTQQSASQVSYPLVVVDDSGRNVTIAKQPQRIVSLIPSATEVVFAAGAGNRVVGVTIYDAYPPQLVQEVKNGSVVVVGSGFEPDVEKIVTLKPDLVIVGGESHVASKGVQKLIGLGFTIVSLNANSIEEVLGDIQKVEAIVGNSAKADQAIASIRQAVDLVISKTRNATKPKVYIENWPDPLFTVSAGALQDEMIRYGGGVNVFSDLRGSVQVNAESVIEKNPNIIIMFHNQTTIDQLKGRPGWSSINAVKNGRIYQMTGYEGAPNPRIGESLLKMAKFIHPELFSSSSQQQGIISNPVFPLGPVIVSWILMERGAMREVALEARSGC